MGNLDSDPELEIVIAEGEFNPSVFAWFDLNKSTNSWTQHNITLTYNGTNFTNYLDYVSDLELADIDGNGFDDIIIPDAQNNSSNGNNVLIVYNNGNGTFQNPVKIWGTTKQFIKDLKVIDIDKDGKLDIALRFGGLWASNPINQAVFLYQNASDSFTPKVQSIAEGDEGMSMGDLDGDNYPDFVYNGNWLKNPSGNRTTNWSKYTIDSSAPSDSRIAIGDLNGDGQNDVVIGNSEGNGPVKWYKRNSDSDWTPTQIASSINMAHTMQIADMDNDGDNDVITASLGSGGIYIYRNSGNGIFNSNDRYTLDSDKSYIGKVGDLNRDGKIDFMTSYSYDGGPMNVWLNNSVIGTNPTNTPAPQPSLTQVPIPTATPTPISTIRIGVGRNFKVIDMMVIGAVNLFTV